MIAGLYERFRELFWYGVFGVLTTIINMATFWLFSDVLSVHYMVANVILDGKVMDENLRHTGKDEKWLLDQIKGQGAKRIEDVLLASCDSNNKLQVYLKDNQKEAKDVLM